MPTYEYEREDGTIFEIIQGIKENPLEECPETGQKCRRLVSGGSEILINGWTPDKERRKKKWKQENPYGTTLPEYQKRIDENTQKALEQEAKQKKAARGGNLSEL